jgi:hypothetical protein
MKLIPAVYVIRGFREEISERLNPYGEPQGYGRCADLRRTGIVEAMGKGIAYLIALIAGVVVVGWVAVQVLQVLLGSLSYLIVGALVVGGGVYLYSRAKKNLAPGTRTQRRIEAAAKTYRMRNR